MAERTSREDRRHQLVNAALTILRHKPPLDIVGEDIADAAGVSRSLVYRYFGSLDELYLAAYREFFRPLEADLEDAARSIRDPYDALARVAKTYFEFARADPTLFRHLVDGGLSLHPAVRRARAARLQNLPHAGELGLDPPSAASMATGMIEAAIIAWLDHGSDRACPGPGDRAWPLVWLQAVTGGYPPNEPCGATHQGPSGFRPSRALPE